MYKKEYIYTELLKQITNKITSEKSKYAEITFTMSDGFEYYFDINDSLGITEFVLTEGYPWSGEFHRVFSYGSLFSMAKVAPINELKNALIKVSEHIVYNGIDQIKTLFY